MEELLKKSESTEQKSIQVEKELKYIEVHPPAWEGEVAPILERRLVEITRHDGEEVSRSDENSDDPSTLAVYFKMLRAISEDFATTSKKSVAVIGGGLCYLPNILVKMFGTVDVYEQYDELKRFCNKKANWVLGDYAKKLKGEYDVIIFDVEGSSAIDLTKCLCENGKIYYHNHEDVTKPI